MFKLFKQDKLALGIVLGLLLPVIGFFLFYVCMFMPRHTSFAEYLLIFKNNKNMIPKVASVCLILNGFIFYFYTQSRRDLTTKGIFLVTMLYAVAILLLKIL
ncbi:hypothetical protein GA0116948_103198 [Chitinophaga costaii]|uniref:Uncharacterized protein n=1 Tax=Chitinophaga costaii TaxID=1335309 RepID=A0A1C4BPA0_9BACT|nr:hypothetical protein [Chitinophaga costaii]PUZ27524.1 hypothetical protein DCM91_04665 [Chitinophaga costaii]SCC08739.1 hypothetical protein GA0116948_103198 [Chitinophaga costaii]